MFQWNWTSGFWESRPNIRGIRSCKPRKVGIEADNHLQILHLNLHWLNWWVLADILRPFWSVPTFETRYSTNEPPCDCLEFVWRALDLFSFLFWL